MKTPLVKWLTLVLLVCVFASGTELAWAERATEQEMMRVCENWVSYMVHERGTWAGEIEPAIVSVQDIAVHDTVLARCFSVSPRGYVVVPILKELPPVQASSEQYDLDVNLKGGVPQLLRDVLMSRARVFIQAYGSLEASQPSTGEVLFGRKQRQEWDRYVTDPDRFKAELRQGAFAPMAEVGPLLTTAWHQGPPYNNLCPQGDLTCTDCCPTEPYTCNPCFPSLVGCVATAAAQIMNYYRCPNNGIGSHTYTWDGDQSCGGSTAGGSLSATFSDAYDWANMPNDCSGGCTPAQEAALAELSYEVGVAFNMDYGVCGSGAYTFDALTVYPTYFGYDGSIDRENRTDHTPQSWFDIIKEQINASHPIHYRIYGHSIVCDGWRDTGGINQYHMNYGWADGHTTWYSIDGLYCPWAGCGTDEEYLIRNIIPGCDPNDPPVAICHDMTVSANDDCEAIVSIDNGSYDPDGDPITFTQSPPAPYPLGATLVTLTVQDDHGWSDQCTATVTVEDHTPPTIMCPDGVTVECSGYCGVPSDDPQLASFFGTFTASDNCDDDLDTWNDAPSCFTMGTTTVTFGAIDDADNEAGCTADVTVVDTTPPTITCPGDVIVECDDHCGTPSDDPQLESFFAAFTATDVCDDDPDMMDDRPDCFPPGTTPVTFVATDLSGNTSACTAHVTVVDTTPPEITVSLNRYVLWPPNHKMADILATVEVEDVCDPNPTFVLTSVESNEDPDDSGDGSTGDDIEGDDIGTPDLEFQLRSERSGNRFGRIYTIVYTATDFSGNTATAAVYVRVPHDQSGMGFAATGFNAEGTGLDRSLEEFAVVIPSRMEVYGIGQNGKTMLIERLFDATELDLTRTYVGNTQGVLLPERWEDIDQNADGLMDLVVWYRIGEVVPLVDHIVQGQMGEDWISDPMDPVGIHYESAGGIDYLVPDVFLLGAPVELARPEGAGVGKPADLAETTGLLPVQPNPFSAWTTVRFNLVAEEHVLLRVYDARGVLIRTLEDRSLPAGEHQAVWDGRDNAGRPVAAGTYFVRFSAAGSTTTEKMMLLK
jgi:hypothetical protein